MGRDEIKGDVAWRRFAGVLSAITFPGSASRSRPPRSQTSNNPSCDGAPSVSVASVSVASVGSAPIRVGDVLAGRFRLAALLGEGGMGQVFAAEDTLVGSTIAIKVIHPGFIAHPEARSHLIDELRMARLVTDPHICRLYDVVECPADSVSGISLLFLTMELFAGETLAERLGRDSRLPVGEAKLLAGQITWALATLNSSGVIHGDLKPANIMLTVKDSKPHAVVMDFGLSSSTQEAGSTPVSGGTPAYLAPERLAGGPPSPAADQWALGLVMAQMFTGLEPRSIFNPVTGALSVGARAELKQIGEPWASAVQRSLSVDPAARFPTSAALRAATARKPLPTVKLSGWKILGLAFAAVVLSFCAAFGWWLVIPKSDIAILPFVNDTGDPDLAYVADDLPGSLQKSLAHLPALNMASWNAGRKFRGPQADARQVGNDLHTRSYLTGRLSRRGAELELAVELVDVSTGERRWSRRYQRQKTELADLEAALVSDVQARLAPGSPRSAVHAPSPAAYELYLRGLSLSHRRSEQNLEEAVEYFREAVAKDPDYALAHAAIAELYEQIVATRIQVGAGLLPRAKLEARRAVELDPGLGEAHAALGVALAANDFNWTDAEAQFREAIRLDPRNAEIHDLFSQQVLLPLRRYEEAIIEAKRSIDLQPDYYVNRFHMVYALVMARRYNLALALLPTAPKETAPEAIEAFAVITRMFRAGALIGLGRVEDAIAATNSVTADPPSESVAIWFWANRAMRACALAKGGHRREAELLLARIESTGRTGLSVDLAAAYLALGDKDRALSLLQRGYSDREADFRLVGSDVRFDGLRDEPRFRALMAKANLP